MRERLRAVLQIFLRVVDAVVRAELLAVGKLLGGRGGGDDARAEQLADLDGRAADAARRTEDEQRLALLEVGPVDERVERGGVRESVAAPTSKETASGSFTTAASGATICSANAPIMSVVATRSPGATLVTAVPTASTTPAASPPGMNGGSALNWYLAIRHQHVRKIHAGRVHQDEHLVGTRRGRGHLVHAETSWDR